MAVVDSRSSKLVRPQAGVYWYEPYRCDVFFVTLDKSEKD